MDENNEIIALLHLIDDPDEEVYTSVSNKLIEYGKQIIPNLETLWECTVNEDVQERIESLIHKLHYRDLTANFVKWKEDKGSLLQGALLVAQYHYAEMQDVHVLQDIEKLRRNIWLELNTYLTPLEQINVLASIFYNYFKQTGVELAYDKPENFLINKTLESKKGNVIGNGIVYLILCEILDIPVKAVNIPRQFLLAYMDPQYDILNPKRRTVEKILFYIDPLHGQMYSHKDVENYFKRISVPPTPSYFRPSSTVKVIQILLEELSKCFDNDRNRYKMEELLSIVNLLDNEH